MKNNIHTTEHLPWAISIEEFRKSGDFNNWTNKSVKEAISTLTQLTIIAFNLSHQNPVIKNKQT